MTKKKAIIDPAKKRKVTDAPESNAGDDFHVLWSVRKSVELINFNEDGLKALTIEGSVVDDASVVDPDGDRMLGVDLGEYFGGEDFQSAVKVIVSQLKYSTRHSTTPWSISLICQGRKTKYTGSIIHRLAQVYDGYVSSFDSKLVNGKLILKLISNRPFADGSKQMIASVQRELAKHPEGLALAKLKSQLDSSLHADLERLHAASSLPAAKFTDFLRLLNFDECGTNSRPFLKEEVIKAITEVNGSEASRNYDSLHVDIWNKMMPENRKNNKITIIDILKVFGFSTVEKLLPVPSRLERETVLVPREQLEEITTAILNTEKTPICLHAGAGMGKSSMVRLIEQQLPRECAAVIFDCYGAGSYLDVVDKRHKPDWALMQISNELAIKIGSPFMLLTPGLPIEVLFREFLDRLKIAGEIVKKTNPGAKVVIIVDAADNSITAAEQSSESSFVTDLVKLEMPEGCTLVLTTRTHRLDKLKLPERHRTIQLDFFSREETKSRLLDVFPEASEDQIDQFHELTKAIPRVQSYALANRDLGLETILEPLKPGGKTVEDLISVNLEFVISKLGSRDLVENILRYLILLPRPVPLNLLSRLTCASEDIVTDVVTDTGQGIVLRNDLLVFTDEDFEDYLRQNYPPEEKDYEAVAAALVLQADSDEYASRHIGNFLLLTRRYEELKEIVFNKKHLSVPKDPVALKEITVDRTRQAMKLSIQEQKTSDFLKLQIMAAEAAKTNDTLTETLLSHADLTAMYGDRETVEKLYFKTDKLSWYGPVHFRCSAVYARSKNTLAEAKAHLKAALSWLDWRQRQPSGERVQYRMSPLDFAYAAEAMCRLDGVEAAMKWLSRNSNYPMDNVTQLLLQNCLDYDVVKDVDKAVTSLNWTFSSRLNILPAYFSAGAKVPFDTSGFIDDFDGLFKNRKLARFPTRRKVVQAAEYLAINGKETGQLEKLLSYSKFKPSGNLPHFYASNQRADKQLDHLDLLFRSNALSAAISDGEFTIVDLYPENLKKRGGKEPALNEFERENKARLDNLFGAVLPLYRLRAEFIAHKIDEEAFLEGFKIHSDSLLRGHDIYRYHRELPYFKTYYAAVFSDMVVYLKDKQKYIKLLTDCFGTNDNAIAVRLDIARQISHGKSAHTAVLSLLKEADNLIFSAQTDAGGKISDFLSCVRIGGKVDHSVGQAYFKKMVETVSEMDIEGFDQIRFVADLARVSQGSYPETAYLFTRFVEYAHSRLKNWDHFPWNSGIEGSSYLDPAGSLAVLCRWDHLKFISLEDFILSASSQAFKRKMIGPEMAVSFLYLNNDYGRQYSEFLDEVFQKLSLSGSAYTEAIAAEVFRLVRYECPLYHQPVIMRQLKSKLDNGSKTYSEIERFLNFHEAEESDDEIEFPKKVHAKIPIPDNLDPTDVKSVKEFLEQTADKFSNTRKLEAIRDNCSVPQYLGFLKVILALDDRDLYYHARQSLLKETLSLWQDHPALEEWKTEHFGEFFAKIFPAYLSREDLLNSPDFAEVAEIFNVDQMRLAEVVKGILPAYIDTLSAGHIYQLGNFTKHGLSETEVIELIQWTLGRWNEKIPEETFGPVWNVDLLVDPSENVSGGLFRYLLGHPKVSVRWRASHALRSLVRWQHAEIMEYLLVAQDQKDCVPYQHRDYTYFWLSAKLWLWMIMSKLAMEDPDAVKKWSSYGLAEIQNGHLPHMLIRLFAQRYCIAIESSFPETFKPDEYVLIENALSSPFKPDVELDESEIQVKAKSELSFDFDYTDTVPYWYQSVCSMFNVSYQTIPSMADDVIVSDWGYTGKIHKDENVRSEEDDFYATRNGHGDIPSVETLHKYYEFHAMFVVAGKLLKTLPLDNSEDDPEPLYEWLTEWMMSFDGIWLADLRDDVPLEKLLHDANRPDDWGKTIAPDRPLHFLKFDTDAPVVKGVYKLHYGKDQESIRIESSLVSRDKGLSLLRALTSAPNYRYKLPEAWEDRMEISEQGFELLGWLAWSNGRDRSYDHFDPFANNLGHSYVELGEILIEHLGAVLSDDHRTTFSNEKPVAGYTNWNNKTSYGDHSRLESQGQLYQFKKDALLSFLEVSGYELIVQCIVSRSRDYDRYDRQNEIPDLKTLYLIKADGTISTVEGNFRLGQ